MAQINKKEYKIAFMPSGKRGSFPEGTTILDASRSLGVDFGITRNIDLDITGATALESN